MVKNKRGVKKKVNLLGDPGVGKTSLMLRFVRNVFGERYLKTIGTNIYTKDVEFSGGKVKLIIQDIMGEIEFNLVQERAFIGSTGAIAVVDIQRPETLDSIMYNWIPRYKEKTSGENPIMLAVNKFDLEGKMISPDELQDVYHLFESTVYTSAKTGRNVEYLFNRTASEIAYNIQISTKDVDDIMSMKNIDTPFELLDALLVCISLASRMPYKVKDKFLRESHIDKFDLEGDRHPIKENNVMAFAKRLIEWYQEKGEEQTVETIREMLLKYNS
ncbi:MAG: Rab family GTPase [Thermoplasmata archaeon]